MNCQQLLCACAIITNISCMFMYVHVYFVFPFQYARFLSCYLPYITVLFDWAKKETKSLILIDSTSCVFFGLFFLFFPFFFLLLRLSLSFFVLCFCLIVSAVCYLFSSDVGFPVNYRPVSVLGFIIIIYPINSLPPFVFYLQASLHSYFSN